MAKCTYCDGTGEVHDSKRFGKKMRRLRLKRGWSLSDLGGKMGYTKAYLSRLELGLTRWRPSLVAAYEKYLGE